MERDYFDEKKDLTIDGLISVGETTIRLMGLVRSWSYEVPDLIAPSEIHDQVRAAKARLDNARRDFEKVRWAAAETELTFNEWLVKHGHSDLVMG